MKKIFAAIALAMALLLTGCGGEGTDYGAKADTLTTQSEGSVEERYLSNVAEHMSPSLYNEAQDDVLALGYIICEKTSDGFTPEEITEVGIRSSLNPSDFGVIAASAVIYLCPEHQDEWSDYMETLSGGYGT